MPRRHTQATCQPNLRALLPLVGMASSPCRRVSSILCAALSARPLPWRVDALLTGTADHLANLTELPAHIRHAAATAVRSRARDALGIVRVSVVVGSPHGLAPRLVRGFPALPDSYGRVFRVILYDQRLLFPGWRPNTIPRA